MNNTPEEAGNNMAVLTRELQTHWPPVYPLLSIRTEAEYAAAVARLNGLLDEVGADEQHPLYGLLDTLGTLIEAYEQQHHPMPVATGAEMVRFFMKEHHLTQSNLPEIGSQSVVSEILSGRRELNVRQFRALASRFHVSPAVFI
jgi:HTH-type transcriptional regulator/antitoxin HigA